LLMLISPYIPNNYKVDAAAVNSIAASIATFSNMLLYLILVYRNRSNNCVIRLYA
jgi:hypothetical protein